MQRTLVGIFLVILIGVTPVAAGDPLKEIVTRINAERQKQQLPKLKPNDKLAIAAQSQADWMANVGKMEHLRGEEAKSFEDWRNSNHHPVNRIINAGYIKWDELFSLEVKDGNQVLVARPGADDRIGEIIAHGVPESGPGRFQPEVIVAGWMNSPGHKKTILTAPYQEIGVGFTRTPRGDAFWCVTFGKPAANTTVAVQVCRTVLAASPLSRTSASSVSIVFAVDQPSGAMNGVAGDRSRLIHVIFGSYDS